MNNIMDYQKEAINRVRKYVRSKNEEHQTVVDDFNKPYEIDASTSFYINKGADCMGKFKIYMDCCCFGRLFDNLSKKRSDLSAKLFCSILEVL